MAVDIESRNRDLSALLQEAIHFCEMANAAAQRILGPAARECVARICQGLLADARLLSTRSTAEVIPIAVVGKVSSGKSWLVRSFLNECDETSEVRQLLNPGQDNANRTSGIRWIGAESPHGKFGDEEFHGISNGSMLSLGRPYVIGDTPGFSDKNPRYCELSQRAACSAAVKIVVIAYDQHQDARIEDYLADMDGALVLMVVRHDGKLQPQESVKSNISVLCQEWRKRHPSASILPPVFMPTAKIVGEKEAVAEVRGQIRSSLSHALGNDTLLRHAAVSQLRERIFRARQELVRCLDGERNRLRGPVDRLETRLKEVPDELVEILLGDEVTAAAIIRRRLLADLLDRTPLLSFPYRSFLGLLVLTAGAWSQLIMSLAGSASALVSMMAQIVGNALFRHRDNRVDGSLRNRIENALSRHVRHEVVVFRTAVDAVRGSDAPTSRSSAVSETTIVTAEGLDRIASEFPNVVRQAVARNRIGGLLVGISSLLGPAVFWTFLSGPILAVYTNYFRGCRLAIEGGVGSLETFSELKLAAFGGSIVLSAIPAMLLALVIVWWSSCNRRVQRVLAATRVGSSSLLNDMARDGRFVVEVDNEDLEAAKFLLAV